MYTKKLSDNALEGYSFSNKRCKNCSEGYPKLCQCGGLYHAGVQQAEGNEFIQIVQCDKCLRYR